MSVDTSYAALLRASAPAILNNVAAPLSSAARLALLAHASADDALTVIAAYTVVESVAAFIVGALQFLLVVSMARSAEAVGARKWRVLATTVRGSLFAALGVGVIGAGAAIALRAPLLRLLALEPRVAAVASAYWVAAAARLPSTLLLRAASGLLVGFQRLGLASAINALLAAADVVAFYAALYPLAGDLAAAGWALALTAALAAAAALGATFAFPPDDAADALRAACCGGEAGGGAADDLRTLLDSKAGRAAFLAACRKEHSEENLEFWLAAQAHATITNDGARRADAAAIIERYVRDGADAQVNLPAKVRRAVLDGHGAGGAPAALFDAAAAEVFVLMERDTFERYKSAAAGEAGRTLGTIACDSLNVLLRSLLLSGSVLALSLAAASLGTAALAAHAAALQVWMLMSYVVDGFADVGTMLGAKLLGAGEFSAMRALVRRLDVLGVASGAAAAAGLAVSLDPLTHLWLAGDAAAAAALASVWPLLCAMQLPNAMVWVWDGVMYASNDSLPYIRNALAVGALGVFAPALWCALVFDPSLRTVWLAKALLNAWRAATAGWRVHAQLWPTWTARMELR